MEEVKSHTLCTVGEGHTLLTPKQREVGDEVSKLFFVSPDKTRTTGGK